MLVWAGATGVAWAQGPPAGEPTAAAPSSSASIANPAISVIGWFQGVAGNDPTLPSEPFALPEAEVGFQAAVDPFSRADFFLSAGPEGLDVEVGPMVETFDRVHRDPEGRVRFHFVIVDYPCVARRGAAVAGSDAEAVAWVTSEELDAYGVNPHAAAVIRKGLEMAAAAG